MAAVALTGNMIDVGGSPAAGCLLTSVIKDTSTPSPLYSDAGLTTPTTNPYEGDADGRLDFYFNDAISYTWTITTADGGTTLWQADIVGGVVTVTYSNGVLIHSSWKAPLASPMGTGWAYFLSQTYGNAYVLDDIDALQSATWSAANAPPIVILKTNHATGDGGGVFFYDASDTSSSDDNGCTILTSTSGTALRYKRLVEADVDLRWFGTGFATSATAAFNAALAYCKASGNYRLLMPIGSITFLTQPSSIDFPLQMKGHGISTVIRRAYAGTTGVGALNITYSGSGSPNGASIRNLAVNAATGSSGGCAIAVSSTAAFATGQIKLEDLYLSTEADDLWTNVIYLKGVDKTSSPIGLRGVFIKDVWVFGANGFSVVIDGVAGLDWDGGGVFPAGGGNSASGGIYLKGDASVPNSGIRISIEAMDEIQVDYCSSARIECEGISGTLVAGANALQTWVYGTPVGGTSLAWASTCRVIPKTGLVAFRAHKNGTNQTGITTATATKITFGTEVLDNGGFYDASTSVFTPPAGNYFIEAQVRGTTNIVSGQVCYAEIRKNSTLIASEPGYAVQNGDVLSKVSAVATANGTDAFTVQFYAAGAGDKTVSGTATDTMFQAHQIL